MAEPDIRINIDQDVFNPVYVPWLSNMARVQILFGGSSSGKSVFAAQRAVIDVMSGGRNYLICRAVARTIRNSVYNEVKKVIADFGLGELFKVNKSEFVITCVNGYQIVFVGLDDVEKIKSITPAIGEFTDIWVEEATETERNDIKQLLKRQRGGDESIHKRLLLTFNPILRSSWLFQEYFASLAWADSQTNYQSEDLAILKTTYKDNAFLTKQDVYGLEHETDSYYYDVYTLGNWGVLGNVIFKNWHVENLGAMRDQFTVHRNGLDFGFSSDPAALSVAHYEQAKKQLFIYDELYETGLTNDKLAEAILGIIGKQYVTCDSAEPKSIKELKTYGVEALGAKKGPDSVLFGIQWLQQQEIFIDAKCINHRNEFGGYKWKEDPKTGLALAEPLARNDHLIDARRYGSEQDMIVRPQARSYDG